MWWRLKSCPRCKGDVVVDRDHDGCYAWCLQCGYCLNLADITEGRVKAGNNGSEGKA